MSALEICRFPAGQRNKGLCAHPGCASHWESRRTAAGVWYLAGHPQGRLCKIHLREYEDVYMGALDAERVAA